MRQWPGVPQEGVQPPSCRPAHPPAGPYPLPGLQSRLFSVSRLSSSCRSSRPVLSGTSSLQAQRTVKAHGWDSRWCPLGPRHPTIEEVRGAAGRDAGGAHAGAAPAAPDRPEGDEVGVEERRTEEGSQQPQDGRARGHVPPPEPGQEGLERRQRCWPPAPHRCPHCTLGRVGTSGPSRNLVPSALPPGAPSWGARAFGARRPGSGSETRGGKAMGPTEGAGGCLLGMEHPLPVSPTLHGWVLGRGGTVAALWGRSAYCLPARLTPAALREAGRSPVPRRGQRRPWCRPRWPGAGRWSCSSRACGAPAARRRGPRCCCSTRRRGLPEGPAAGTGRPPRPRGAAPAGQACDTWMPTFLTRPFRLWSGPWEPRSP